MSKSIILVYNTELTKCQKLSDKEPVIDISKKLLSLYDQVTKLSSLPTKGIVVSGSTVILEVKDGNVKGVCRKLTNGEKLTYITNLI